MAVDRQHTPPKIGHQCVQVLEVRRVLVRHRVADGVGDVDVVAPSSIAELAANLGGELDIGASRVDRRELDVLDASFACARPRRGPVRPPSSARGWSWLAWWMSYVEMKVWMCRAASLTQAGSMSATCVRASRDYRECFDVREISCTTVFEIAGRGAPRSRPPPAAELFVRNFSSFSCVFSEIPGYVHRRAASCQRCTISGLGLAEPSMSLLGFLELASSRCWSRGYVRPLLCSSPRGGRRRNRRSSRSAICWQSISLGLALPGGRASVAVDPSWLRARHGQPAPATAWRSAVPCRTWKAPRLRPPAPHKHGGRAYV